MDIIKTIINNRLNKDEFYNWYSNNYNYVINAKYDNIFNYINNLPDINIAVNELIYNMLTQKLIILCVDIDHDGCTSGTIGYKMLTTLFPSVIPKVRLIISSRKYKRGFNQDMIDKINNIVTKENKLPGLIITADMGSTDEERYKQIKSSYKDIKILVTDHHTVEYNNYPNSADAFINVHRDDFTLDKCICGCTTLFFLLVQTYFKFYKIKDKNLDIFKDYLPYVAAATLVDNMSMKYPINRYLVKLGIKFLNINPDRNYTNIKNLLSLPNILSYKDISMSIGPLINTGNRLNFEQLTLYSLTTEDDIKSIELIKKLIELSKIRKQMTQDVLRVTLQMNNIHEYKNIIVVIAKTRISIAGILANNILSMVNKPCICFMDKHNTENKLVGSARSIPGINLLAIVKQITDCEIEANGHEAAFGISIPKDKLKIFKEQLNNLLESVINNLPTPTLTAELLLEHKDINLSTYEVIELLAPYGIDWKQPICSSNTPFQVVEIIPIKNFYKLKLLKDDGEIISAFHFFKENITSGIYFNNFTNFIHIGSKVILYFYLTNNYYKEEYSIGLEIIDIHLYT